MAIALPMAGATAAPVSFSATGTAANGIAIAAAATFSISGDLLTVTLRNTAPGHGADQRDTAANVLTGLTFDVAGRPALTAVSATVVAGSIIQGAMCDVGLCTAGTTDVGGEYHFAAQGAAGYGVASAGHLGDAPSFGGPNLDGRSAVGAVNFGLVSDAPGYNPGGALSNKPLVRGAVTFVLSGALGLTEDGIAGVSFIYGAAGAPLTLSAASTPSTAVPEPGALGLLGLGLLGLAAAARRLRHGRSPAAAA